VSINAHRATGGTKIKENGACVTQFKAFVSNRMGIHTRCCRGMEKVMVKITEAMDARESGEYVLSGMLFRSRLCNVPDEADRCEQNWC